MRERKYVKFRIDMHEDTKFKIIDRMPKRDLIHYVWNRFVLLAGKVNKEGDLYMSKNIPYTVEILAIEFNRDIDEIKAALDVLIELEMMEFIEDRVYRVKNFAKHQNIKVKEKVEIKNKENEVNDMKNKMIENEAQAEELQNKACTVKNEETNDKVNKFDIMPLLDCVEENSGDANKSNNKENEKTSSSLHNNIPVILEMKKQKTNRKNKKVNKNKIRDNILETEEDNLIENIEEEKDDVYFWTTGEDVSLKVGERVVSEWGF